MEIFGRNFCCCMKNLTGAKVLSGLNFVLHSAVWIFLATIVFEYTPWFEYLILIGGLIGSLGYALIIIGLIYTKPKIILGAQVMVVLGVLLFTIGTISVAVVFNVIWFFRPIWGAILTYLPLQIWNGCLVFGSVSDIKASICEPVKPVE